MKRNILLAAVGTAALTVAAPALAQDFMGGGGGGNDPSLDIDVDYDSYVNSDIDSDVEYRKDVKLEGEVELKGEIRVDSSAVAINDPAQMLDDLDVEAAGDNRVREFNVGGTGNIGANLAAGTLNQQMNSAVIAVSEYLANGDETARRGGDHDDHDGSSGGWAEATTTAVQSLNDLTYDPERDRDGHNGNHRFNGDYDDDDGSNVANRVAGGSVAGSGNIGVNAAAGAFNQQANLMTIAVATNSALAEANAGLLQSAMSSDIEASTGNNVVGGLTIDAGSTGNIGVNLAAGVGNQQINALTIASTSTGD